MKYIIITLCFCRVGFAFGLAETWKNALSFLTDGWMLETNVISRVAHYDSKPKSFPDPVSALINDECRMDANSGHYFTTSYRVSLTYKPAKPIYSFWRQFVFTESVAETNWSNDKLHFDEVCRQFIGYLSRHFKIEVLKGTAATSFLYQCITGKDQNLIVPYKGAFLDAYLSSEPFVGGLQPKIGEHFIKLLAIDDLPHFSYPTILETLTHYPMSYRWSTRFIAFSSQTAKSYLKHHERNWSSKAIGIMGVIKESMNMPVKLDQDAQHTADALSEAQMSSSSGELGYGLYNSSLILMDSDLEQLTLRSQEMLNHIQQLDFRVRVEDINAVECYLGSIPSHGYYHLRKSLVDTAFLSHAVPSSRLYQGEPMAPCPYYPAGS